MANLAFANSAKSVASTSTLTTQLGVKNAANQAITLDELDIGFDGTNSANGPAIVDIASCTFATNSPGTNSSSGTAHPSDTGRPETVQSTVGNTWTAQPTVITIWKSIIVPTYMGSALAPTPLMKPQILKGGNGTVVDVTLPNTVTANMTATQLVTE